MEYPYGKLKIQIFTQKDLQNLNKVLLDNAVDCDKIGNVLSVRSRKEGDKFSSARRKNTKTLKKLFNEAKIPQPKRVCIPVVSSGEKPFGLRASVHHLNFASIKVQENL